MCLSRAAAERRSSPHTEHLMKKLMKGFKGKCRFRESTARADRRVDLLTRCEVEVWKVCSPGPGEEEV